MTTTDVRKRLQEVTPNAEAERARLDAALSAAYAHNHVPVTPAPAAQLPADRIS